MKQYMRCEFRFYLLVFITPIIHLKSGAFNDTMSISPFVEALNNFANRYFENTNSQTLLSCYTTIQKIYHFTFISEIKIKGKN